MQQCRWPQGDSSVPRETDGATASANKEVRKAQEHARRRKEGCYHHYDDETRAKIANTRVIMGTRLLLVSSLLSLNAKLSSAKIPRNTKR